jgi:osomolarity two-component system sensor histidine kinase NIK1
VIGDRERCLQAGMDDHITSSFCFSTLFVFLFVECLFLLLSEPLRRGDLLNAINKLAGERGAQKIHHHLMRRPIPQNYSS